MTRPQSNSTLRSASVEPKRFSTSFQEFGAKPIMKRSTVSRVRPRFFAYSLARASPGKTPAKYFATLRFRSYSGCVLPVLSG